MTAGYPYGFKSFSAGIISNVLDGLPLVELVGRVFQTDAMANPGALEGLQLSTIKLLVLFFQLQPQPKQTLALQFLQILQRML